MYTLSSYKKFFNQLENFEIFNLNLLNPNLNCKFKILMVIVTDNIFYYLIA